MSQQPNRATETPKEWARRVLAEHGPPPKEVEDRIRSVIHRQRSK